MSYANIKGTKALLEKHRKKRKKGDDVLITPLNRAKMHETRTDKGQRDQRNFHKENKRHVESMKIKMIEMGRMKSGRKDWRIPKNLRKLFGTSKLS